MSKHATRSWHFERGGGRAYNRIVCAESFHKHGRLRNLKTGISSASFSDVVCENLGDPDIPAVAANIALLLAAPKMAEALRELLPLVLALPVGDRLSDAEHHGLMAVIEAARAALADAGIEETPDAT